MVGKGAIEFAESYDCARDCQAHDGKWIPERRASRGCNLPGLPSVPHAPTVAGLWEVKGSPYMGRQPNKALAGTRALDLPVSPVAPWEPPEDGCPGAWYRTKYIDSIWPYVRRRTGDGGRVPNPRFDAADWQIQGAVMRLEAEEERWHSYILKVGHERDKAAAEARERAAGNSHGGRSLGRKR